MSIEVSHVGAPLGTKARGRRSRGRAISVRRKNHRAPVWGLNGIPAAERSGKARRRTAAIWELALRYQNGEGVRQNFDKAFGLFEKAAALGDPEALFNVGTYWENGIGVPQRDLANAAFYYFRAALAGSVEGVYALGVCFGEGIGFPRNEKFAAELFAYSARRGISEGAYSFGQCLLHGRGVKRDVKAAFCWLMQAAESGFAPAQLSVGLCFLRGEGVKRDPDAAREFLRQAAEGGDELAAVELKRLPTKSPAGGNGRH